MPTVNPDRMISEEEFEQIYKANYDDFVRYAISIFKSHGSKYVSVNGRAEEAVQEMFAFAWKNRSRMAQSPKPVGWLYKVLAFKVQELLREDRTWVKHLLQISENYGNREYQDFHLKAEMEDIISPEDYLLLKHLYIDGYTYTEVCAELGLKKSALAMRLKRIKERFIKGYAEKEKIFSNTV